MRRSFYAALATVMAATLVGCGGEDTKNSVTNNLTEPEPQPSASPSPGQSPSPTPSSSPDSLYVGPAELHKYVQKFVDDAKAQGVDVLPHVKNPTLELRIMDLGAWSSSTIGLCETSKTRRRLTVDPDFWRNATEERRELLMHHELGHCVLNRRHRSGTLSSGILVSVMGPKIMSGKTYLANYDYYQAELFDRDRLGWSSASSTTIAGTDADGGDFVVTDVCDENDLR